MAVRGIRNEFIEDLKSGKLSFFLLKLRNEPDKYVIGIRKDYINIYYKGGSIVKITWHKNKRYEFKFDKKYCKALLDTKKIDLLQKMDSYNEKDFIKNFGLMREAMDRWFLLHPKEERRYQQELVRHNDFVIDLEYQIGRKMRLDMLMVVDNALFIVENKYGNGAIGGDSGIENHYKDFVEVFNDKEIYDDILKSVENISSNLYELGLRKQKIEKEDVKEKQILFLLGGYDFKSEVLNEQIKKIKHRPYSAKVLFLKNDEFIIDTKKAEMLITKD